MQKVRRHEQNKAAVVGEYGAMIQLDHPSSVAKSPSDPALVADLIAIFRATQPEVVYTHNLADKHETHIGVAIAVVQALRLLSPEWRPQALYGCEVWRNLDWMLDEDKTVFDVSARENVVMALMGVFDSQISGGKRYDLATAGRKRSNATYLASHASDRARMLEYAMDLTPLIENPGVEIAGYVRSFIDRFSEDVGERIVRRLGR